MWSVRYNHSHDQLLLTASSDSRVILSNMVSISSEPFGHLVDDDDLSDSEENHHEEKYVSLTVVPSYLHVFFLYIVDICCHLLYFCHHIFMVGWCNLFKTSAGDLQISKGRCSKFIYQKQHTLAWVQNIVPGQSICSDYIFLLHYK